jgi:hypothetical protein
MNFILVLLFCFALVDVNGSHHQQRNSQARGNTQARSGNVLSGNIRSSKMDSRGVPVETTTEATTTESTTEATTTTESSTTAPILVSCTQNTDCPETLPFCQEGSKTCQSCITDYDCRNQTRCNSICVTNNLNQNKCATRVGETRLVCEVNEVCYKFEGSCQRSCIRSGTSSNGDPVSCDDTSAFTIPVDKVCNPTTGVCTACLTNNDCGVSANATCNSMCNYDSFSYQSFCSTGTMCTGHQRCLLPSTSTNYICYSSSASLMVSSFVLLGMILGILL